jgi:hypothetical protein
MVNSHQQWVNEGGFAKSFVKGFRDEFDRELLDAENFCEQECGVPTAVINAWSHDMRHLFKEMEQGVCSIPESLQKLTDCVLAFEKNPGAEDMAGSLMYIFVKMTEGYKGPEEQQAQYKNTKRFAESEQMREKCAHLLRQSDRYSKELSSHTVKVCSAVANVLEKPKRDHQAVFVNLEDLLKKIERETAGLPKETGVRKWLAKLTKRFR